MFKIKVQLPSGKSIRVAELKNSQHQVILKYCENSDLEGLNEFFNSLISEEYKALDIIDKFYLLLTIRMIFIDPDLSFSDKDGHTVRYSISNILEKIDHIQDNYESEVSIAGGIIVLGLPNLIYFKDINDVYVSTIKSIKLNNKVLSFNSLTFEEREEVLSHLPNSLFAHINKHITQISKQLQSFVLIEQNTQFNIEEVNTNIISNEFMGFILSIFSSGLKNFFDIMYAFTTKINIDGNTFLNLTPLDSRVLINLYNKDIDEQNRALQNKVHE